MRRHAFLPLLILLACSEDVTRLDGGTIDGGDSDGGAIDASPTDAAPTHVDLPDPVLCGQGTTITSSAAIVALAAQAEWPSIGRYTNRRIPVSADLVLTSTLTLLGSALPLPESCSSRPDCEPAARFRLHFDLVPGATLGGEQHWIGYPEVTLTPGTYRARFFLVDTHPSEYNFRPIVEILPPCGTSCGPRPECPLDRTCHVDFEELCRACLSVAANICACQAAEGPKADETQCSFALSGDIYTSGTCRSGVCVPVR